MPKDTAICHISFRRFAEAAAAVCILAIIGCGRSRVTVVDDAALRAADADPANWITYGHTYSEQRFSPLQLVNEMIGEGFFTHAVGAAIGVGRGEMVHESLYIPKMRGAIAVAISHGHAEISGPVVGIVPRQNHAPLGFAAA